MATQSIPIREAPALAPEYEFHEAANLFPLLGEKELNDLSSDIKKNGLQREIVLLDRKILDGRNRPGAHIENGSLEKRTGGHRDRFFSYPFPSHPAMPPL